VSSTDRAILIGPRQAVLVLFLVLLHATRPGVLDTRARGALRRKAGETAEA
jgi:hypothetical protein